MFNLSFRISVEVNFAYKEYFGVPRRMGITGSFKHIKTRNIYI